MNIAIVGAVRQNRGKICVATQESPSKKSPPCSRSRFSHQKLGSITLQFIYFIDYVMIQMLQYNTICNSCIQNNLLHTLIPHFKCQTIPKPYIISEITDFYIMVVLRFFKPTLIRRQPVHASIDHVTSQVTLFKMIGLYRSLRVHHFYLRKSVFNVYS